MRTYNIYLTQLSDENQKHIRHCIKIVSDVLLRADARLRSYQSENAEAETCSVIKTIEDLKQTIAAVEVMVGELVKAHGLPHDLGHVTQDYRKDLMDFITGSD